MISVVDRPGQPVGRTDFGKKKLCYAAHALTASWNTMYSLSVLNNCLGSGQMELMWHLREFPNGGSRSAST